MIEMQVVNTRPGKPRDGGTRLEAFEADIDLSAAGTSDYVLIPSDVNNVTVTVSFTGGAEGYIEATTDKIEKVLVGTAVWITWTQGQVSSDTQDSAYPPTALRAVQVGAGTMHTSVRAQ